MEARGHFSVGGGGRGERGFIFKLVLMEGFQKNHRWGGGGWVAMRKPDRQLSIKAEWPDALLALWNFSQSNKQKLSVNVTISLHSHLHLHQSILPILSCGAALISSLQLHFSSDTKRFLGITAWGSISNSFKLFICLIFSSLISVNCWHQKKILRILSISMLINIVGLFKQCIFCIYFFYIIFYFTRDDVEENDAFK